MHAALYQILANPVVCKKLKAELASLKPSTDGIPPLAETEALTYLGAIIQETIRIHPGVISRQLRVSPEVPILYTDKIKGKEYSVPQGTVYSMSPLDIHFNADYFVEPYEFRPERWIENPGLARYFLGFGRGSRNCLGYTLPSFSPTFSIPIPGLLTSDFSPSMALARRELALTLATLFLKYDLYRGQEGPTMELYDTERARDIDAQSDFIAPFPTPGSKSLQVKFRN